MKDKHIKWLDQEVTFVLTCFGHTCTRESIQRQRRGRRLFTLIQKGVHITLPF